MTSIIKSFDPLKLDLPNSELITYLEKDKNKIYTMNPTKFEKLVSEVYKNYFNCEVAHIGGPNDNGIDAYAIIADEVNVIQVKRRSNKNSTEGVSTVREFLGAMISQNKKLGHIVSSASKFSYSAKELVKNQHLTALNINIKLVSAQELFNMLTRARQNITSPLETIIADFRKTCAQ